MKSSVKLASINVLIHGCTYKQEVKVIEEKKETVLQAANHTTDDIVKGIATLKLSLVRSLEDIEEQLLGSRKQLTTFS